MKIQSATKAALFLVMASSAGGSWAQQETESKSLKSEAGEPYEVVVSGRPTRARYQELIEDVEEDFFAKFNELNIDDEYDMYCYEYTPTMSHIKRRACEPLFMIARRAKNASDAVFMISAGGNSAPLASKLGGVYLESPDEMVKYEKRNYEVLVKKMEELTASNRELGEIASVMEQLKFQLENYRAD